MRRSKASWGHSVWIWKSSDKCDLSTLCIYLCVKKIETDISSVQGVQKRQWAIHTAIQEILCKCETLFFFCEDGQTLEVCLDRMWSLQRLGVSPEWYWLCLYAIFSGDLSVIGAVHWIGLVDLQRWLPTLSLL